MENELKRLESLAGLLTAIKVLREAITLQRELGGHSYAIGEMMVNLKMYIEKIEEYFNRKNKNPVSGE